MKQIQNFFSSHFVASSFLYTTILFIVVFMILQPGYGTNDDIQMIATVSGYMGGRSYPFLVFSNVLLGFVLEFFYALYSTINWEIWLFVVIHFCSVWALVYLVLCSPLRTGLKTLDVLIILLSDTYFILNLTFSTVAVIATVAGFCLLLTVAQSLLMFRQNRFLLGVVLILVGSLVRPESTGLVIAILIPGLFICYRFFSIKNLILAFSVSGILVLGCYIFNLVYLRQFPDWYFFYIYTTTRSMLHDTPRLMNIDRETLRSIHWTTNDLNMFARWFFPDPHTYSLQNLRYLVKHVSDKRPTFLNRLFSFPGYLLGEHILPYTLLIVLAWLGLLAQRMSTRRVSISAGLTLLTALVVNIYLLWTQKLADYVLLSSLASSTIFTMFIGFWSSSSAASTLFPSDQDEHIIKGHGIGQPFLRRSLKVLSNLGSYTAFLFLLFVAGIVIQQSVKTSSVNVKRETVYHEMLSDIRHLDLARGGQNPLIISPAFGIPWGWSDPFLLDFPRIQYLWMAWNTFSPAYDNVLWKYQVDSLPEALYEKKNVYLMTDETTMRGVVKFIEYHENVVIKPRLIYKSDYNTGTLYDEARLYRLEVQP